MAIYQDNKRYINRLQWLLAVFVIGFSLLVLRLWYLSVLQFEYYRRLAERNQERLVPLPAPRGYLVDREGKILVENNSAFDLLLYRQKDQKLEGTLEFLADGLGKDLQELRERLTDAAGKFGAGPVVVAENLSFEDVSWLLAHRMEHPELEVSRVPKRVYPNGKLASHALGHVGEVSLQELESGDYPEVDSGDFIGKYGLERSYNVKLTGRKGERRLRVDSRGQSLFEIGNSQPSQGEPLTLTLDLDIQREAEESLGDNPGAVVALDPNTGEILALASHPSFDPNLFSGRISRKDWQSLVDDPDHPLQNRVIQSRFSPGSIFKVVMALAGLESGTVDTETSVYCSGGVELYGHFFRCWSYDKGGHGRVRLIEAIQHSCNVYFYLLGQKMGIDEIARFSRSVGLGRLTGVDLAGEIEGLVPSPEWKRKTQNMRWYAGETISVSIGQGPLSVTPIQLARAMGVIATGRSPTPHLVKGVGPPEASELPALRFNEDSLRAVRDGMWRVVNAGGTGRAARVAGFDVCGKTGTVQTISRQTRRRLREEEAARFQNNAWFVGFAPRDNPLIVVAVLVERGVSSGGSAGPAAGRIFRTFYEKLKGRRETPFDVAALSVSESGNPIKSEADSFPGQ